MCTLLSCFCINGRSDDKVLRYVGTCIHVRFCYVAFALHPILLLLLQSCGDLWYLLSREVGHAQILQTASRRAGEIQRQTIQTDWRVRPRKTYDDTPCLRRLPVQCHIALSTAPAPLSAGLSVDRPACSLNLVAHRLVPASLVTIFCYLDLACTLREVLLLLNRTLPPAPIACTCTVACDLYLHLYVLRA